MPQTRTPRAMPGRRKTAHAGARAARVLARALALAAAVALAVIIAGLAVSRVGLAQPIAPPIAPPTPGSPGPLAPPGPPGQPGPPALPGPGQPGLGQPAPGGGPVIQRIVVEGNQRIEAETVLSYMPLRAGQAYDLPAADASLKALFATGLFSDVSIRLEGSDLVVRVVENPIINRIAFEGNSAIDNDNLEQEVQLQPRSIFTRAKVQTDTQRILDLYRRSGRFAATVEPKVIELEQNRIDLVFEISEGPLTGITAINFIGNAQFSDSELRGQIATSVSAWWKLLTTSDNYDPDRLAFDRELLRRFYITNGYADFRVLSAVAQLSPDGRGFFITFTVEEGAQYDFGAVAINSTIEGLDLDDLRDMIPFDEGERYDASRLDQTVDSLTFAAGAAGFAFARVRLAVDRQPEERLIAVTFHVDDGPRVYVERININGNSRTLDDVIRRNIRLAEGDAFNRVLLARSDNNIRALGFFQSVEILEQPGTAPDRVILDVNVTEQSTGSLSFGLGFSSTDDIVGDLSLTERNFRGYGQQLRASLAFSSNRTGVDLSFTEPYFLNRNVAAGIDLFTTETDFQDESSFDRRTAGGRLRFGFPLTEDSRFAVRYSYLSEEIFNVSDDASLSVRQSEGTEERSSIGYTYSIDQRNDPLAPTAGWSLAFDQDYTGLGGSVNLLQQEALIRTYYEVYERWVATLKFTGGYMVGLRGEDVRINDRFFKGGASFRGFERAGVGPRDLVSDDSLGAQAFFINTLEVAIPLGFVEDLGITNAVFTDFGWIGITDDESVRTPAGAFTQEVADDFKFRASAGITFYWDSPIGPVRFDLAKAFQKEPYDKLQDFRFSAGTQF